MLKTLLFLGALTLTRADWFDDLDDGSISGYLMKDEIVKYFEGLKLENNLEKIEIGKSFNGHDVLCYGVLAGI